jgi:hypothetical protein
MKFQEWLLDKRVIRHNIRRGFVSRADYQSHLASLPDMSGNVAHDDPADWSARAVADIDEPDEVEDSDVGGGE